MSSVGIAASTAASVLIWYLVLFVVALWGQDSFDTVMPVLFILGIPILPGASLCGVVGVHSSACLPASVIGNILFYVVVVFIVRSRRSRQTECGRREQGY